MKLYDPRKQYSLREHEPEEIRDDPAVIQARHDLAADSQNYRWMLHLVRHSRLMRRYLTVRFDAERRLVPPDAEPYPPPEPEPHDPPYDWGTDDRADQSSS